MKKEKSEKSAKIWPAVWSRVKGLIFPIALCAVIVGAVFFVANTKTVEEEEERIEIRGYEGSEELIVKDNGKLKLTMDPVTTQFTVEVKSTGKVWRSNPENVEADGVALAEEKAKLNSTLLLKYSEKTGLMSQYSNYDLSVANKLYTIEEGDDYIRVDYSLGKVQKEFFIPPVCLEADFNAYMEAMDSESKNLTKRYYKKLDINKLSKADTADKENLLASYPIMETEVIYILRPGTNPALQAKMEGYFAEIGYSEEQYAKDKELNKAESSSDKPVFNVNMTYRLDGEDLVVEVAMKDLESRDKYPIYSLNILPYFGAGSDADEGYMLVPEGGGAIINYNNGKTAQNPYYANVYGWDYALRRDSVVHNTRVYYNAFGMVKNDSAYLCILEDGSSYASIQADVAGRLNSYNYVNAEYSIRQREQYNVSDLANSAIYVYLPEVPDEKISQRYRFVDTTQYAELAKVYQNYLVDKYEGYMLENDDATVPVGIEIVGAVDKVRQILGLPVSRPLELTTFEEAEEILKTLSDEGVTNMSVKISGWCNNGINQRILNKAKPISALGGKKKLQSLVDTAKDLGIDIYLDGVTQYAYDSTILNGFNSFIHAARFISKERAELYQYSAITYSAREGADSFYLLHADKAMEMAENLEAAADTYGAGISFREIGMDLSADYYKKNLTTRQTALNQQVDFLKELVDADKNVMINMGNSYAVPYSDMVTNMDLQGSEYTILDSFVPFYQMALHGYVNYTGRPLNLTGYTEDELLRSAEYGAGLNFTFMKESTFVLQKTLYTEYYGADFDAWHERMIEIYTRYNEEMGHLFNQKMTNHEILMTDVACTTYEDGTKVYVNYSYTDATAPDGTTVPARDYKVVR